jgi:hypothetical protein
MAEPVSSLLQRSVEHLSHEVPDSYRLTADTLGPVVVAVDVDGERFSMSGGDELTVAVGDTDAAHVRVATTRAAIVDVLDAVVGLADAVEAGTVKVSGPLDHVLRVHDTLLAYVHATVRAPAQAGLLETLRTDQR